MTQHEAISAIERRYHDAHASRFDVPKLLKWFRAHSSDQLWREIVPLLRGRTALDVGCGLGFDSVLLAENGFSVTAVDISPLSVERAKLLAKIRGVNNLCSFRVADLNAQSEEGKYDIVFGRAVLHHLTARPLAESLRKLRGNLEPHGCMIFVEPLDRNPAVLLNRKILDPYDRTPTEKPLNLRKTIEAFRKASLNVKHREYYLTSTAAHIFRKVVKNEGAFASSQSCLMKVDGILMKLFPPIRECAWISLMIAHLA